jgi:electron transfer flavoprotein beta subunit
VNILVMLKQTFDTEEKITIESGEIIEDGVKFIINPYDEYAIEEAIRIKEKIGGKVTVVTVGTSRSESALRTALAMGADQAILVGDEMLYTDEHSISKILAAVAKRESYDLVFGGYTTVDGGSSQVGPRLAEELNIPHISAITKLEINEEKVLVYKDIEGDTEIIESSIPILLTAQQGLNEPRYPSLMGVMKANKKSIESLTAKDLNLDSEAIKAKSEVLDQFLPTKKEAGRILGGKLAEQVSELVEVLRREAKVI